jgi:hypothetical protein
MTGKTDNSTPAAADTTPETFEGKVNAAVKTMVKDNKGILRLPEGAELSEEVTYAANLESRRRQTQSQYVKSRQELSEVGHVTKALKDKLAKRTTIKVTADQQIELDELKGSDPDAWKAKLDGYEAEARAGIDTEFDEVGVQARELSEVDRRLVILDEYKASNPGFDLTDDILANDVPKRITSELESGKITFEDFLGKVNTYLTSNKVITPAKDEKETKQPNLGDLAGKSTPEKVAVKKSINQSYAKTDIY